MANYILFDTLPPEEFVNAVTEGSKMEWKSLYLDGRACVKKYRRILNYFIFPIQFLFLYKKIRYVIAWQQFYGLMSAFLNRWVPIHNKMRITVMTFIYKPKKSLIGSIYKWFVKKAITSSTIENIVTFSKSEVDYYSKIFPEVAHKFKFIPLGIEDRTFPSIETEDYIFTSGISNRDYDFLCEAIANTNYKLKIACPNVKINSDCTNIEILQNCYGTAMLKELNACKIVVIPLKDRNISSGQLMLLQAMQAGKPVIITDSEGIHDYVDHGKNAFLFNNDREELLHYIQLLYEDSATYQMLSKEAKIKVHEYFSIRCLGENIAQIVMGLK